MYVSDLIYMNFRIKLIFSNHWDWCCDKNFQLENAIEN